jgi:DNA 3'-phosphatase
MDCKDIIKSFLSYFKIPNEIIVKKTVIDFLNDPKNKIYLNNLQQIFFYDLIKASNLFDNFQELVDFFSNQINFKYLQKLFSKFQPFVSFRSLDIKTIDITGFEDDDILSDLIFNGWDLEYNNPAFILSNSIENSQKKSKSSRYITLTELRDILNPPSVFQFSYKKEYLEKKLKAIGFDIDGTLVTPDNILLPGIKEKLKKLYQSGYNLILISNQKRIKINDLKLKDKLQKISSQIDLPLIAYCSREEDFYRKPLPGISYLIPTWMGKLEVYVGEATGRPLDDSSDNILLSKNLNIPFFTPEYFFKII